LNESIRAVERALNILLCFSMQTPELSMTQISEQVGLHKSTVHRLLATLERMRFVQRDPVTSMYRPGIRLLQMAYLTMEHNDLSRIALPFMRQLGEQHRETIDLSVLDDSDVVFTEVVESQQRVKLAAAKGQRLPAFCTASGKAIMAFLSKEKVQAILDRGLTRYTEYSPCSSNEVWEYLAVAKQDGFSISEQELEEGINAVSAPIFDAAHHPIASIAIAGPAYRLTKQRMIEIGPDIVAACEKISKELQMASDPQLQPETFEYEDEVEQE
jgi:DNA-binding IclR family transcriptional regulator